MNPEGYDLAKTLIELGANVTAYRPGRHGGTPLHHAAKRGLDRSVSLLLLHGADCLVRNDNCQTTLDVARFKGFIHVVRLIEGYVSVFSGWMREFYGPGFLEVLAPKLLSRKIWTVITPCAPHNPAKPLKLELAIYSNFQDAQPRVVILLWKADIEEPKLNLQDPTVIIFDKPTGTRYRFAASSDGNKQQIRSFYNACSGIPQVVHCPSSLDTASAPTDSTQTAKEEAELAMALNAYLQSGINIRPDNLNGWANSTNKNNHNEKEPSFLPPSKASASGWIDEQNVEQNNGWGVPVKEPDLNTQTWNTDNLKGWGNSSENTTYNGWGLASESLMAKTNDWIDTPNKELHNDCRLSEPKVDKNKFQLNETCQEMYNGWGVSIPKPLEHNTEVTYMTQSYNVPSAPPIPMEGLEESAIEYPSIDFSPAELSVPCLDNEKVGIKSQVENKDGSSCCVICWEAPVEGACVPCGHMAGCMACLSEVQTKKGDCPVCRTKINRVIRIYAV